jgi:hypothetical protein
MALSRSGDLLGKQVIELAVMARDAVIAQRSEVL